MKLQHAIVAFCCFVVVQSSVSWRWECEKGNCVKKPIGDNVKDALSLSTCQLFCNVNNVFWPLPSKITAFGNQLAHVNINSIDVLMENADSPAGRLFTEAAKRFKKQISDLIPKNARVQTGGRSLIVNVKLQNTSITKLTLQTDESYDLNISELSDGRISADITAANYFGGRHGLETLNQVIIFDDIHDEIRIITKLSLFDGPVYPYRGILLDTARNYFSVESIKRTIDAMASSKLNTFHWHLTDTQSFPFVVSTRPELSQLGAYTPHKIYSANDIAEIIEYATVRGVRVMPEFDAPAHVGEGWQNTDFVECFKDEPWAQTCVEPPCGQLNPTKPALYDVLEDIYGEMVKLFQPDIFHMGGDEVSVICWNKTENILAWMKHKGWNNTEADFMKLWDHFQSQAVERFDKKSGRTDIPIIMWTSTLTKANYVDQYLPKDRYIIQIWTTGTDQQIKDLLDKDYRLIISNYDALYLDCGFGAWVGSGNNWCSPYIGWQKVYDNSPKQIANDKAKNILGSEAALWAEQADDQSLDNRLWPRAAALAERLWSEPETSWVAAEKRMLIHRERLVERGIASDTLEPEWCRQNQGLCYG